MDPTPTPPTTDGDPEVAEPAGTPAPPRGLLGWPALVALFLLPGALWALASPPFSAPDEPSHAVKAVAVWHGQLSGTDETSPDGYVVTTFPLPGVWAQASPLRECFAFHPDVTADCAPPFAGSLATTGVTTTAGHYPPAFYALVGWAGRLWPGEAGLIVMRLVGALVSAGLLAAAVRALARVIDPRLAVAGVLVAATPIAQFLMGTVNPNGVEIAAAIAVWSTLLAIGHGLDRHPDDRVPRGLAVQLAVTGSVLAVTRPLSPAFLAAIVVLAVATVPVATLRVAGRRRELVVAGAVVAGVAAASVLVLAVGGSLASMPGRIGVGTTNPALVILGETSGYVTEMIGVVGWLDTQPPAFALYAWLALVLGLVALGLALGTGRQALSLLAVLAATVALPVVAQYPSAARQGLPWQGRYTLPLAVGLPLLAVVVLDGCRPLAASLTRRVPVGVAVVAGTASVATFAWALRRYATGASGSLRFWSGAWQPPGGALLLVAGMVVFAVGGAVLAVRARPGGPAPPPTDAATTPP